MLQKSNINDAVIIKLSFMYSGATTSAKKIYIILNILKRVKF